jgi:hypothetical protein
VLDLLDWPATLVLADDTHRWEPTTLLLHPPPRTP